MSPPGGRVVRQAVNPRTRGGRCEEDAVRADDELEDARHRRQHGVPACRRRRRRRRRSGVELGHVDGAMLHDCAGRGLAGLLDGVQRPPQALGDLRRQMCVS